MVFKFSKLLLLTIVLLMLTACGSVESTAAIDLDVEKVAVEKISSYAEDDSNPEPIKEDYINAGVENISAVDIDELNALVAASEATDVDSLDELNSLTLTLIDTTPPIISLNGEATITIILNKVYSDLGATAKDDKDGIIDVVTDKSTVINSKIGTYTVTYSATDSSSNFATASRTVKVVEDLTPPVITISSPTTLTEEATFTPTATAFDTKDGTVAVTIDTSKVDTSMIGTYDVIYTAVDTAGNSAEIIQPIAVTALTISDLFEKSMNGEINDVTYIVVGDSTRNYLGTNTVLIDTHYPELLSNKNIYFQHTSMAGQRVDFWLGDENRDGNKFLISDTLSKINNANPKHTIVEFSMGINDFLFNNRVTKESLKDDIRKSIIALQATGAKILLVSPVPYFNYSETSYLLNDIYQELESEGELNLPFVSGYNALLANYPNNTIGDALHPNENASKVLVDNIFMQIANNNL